MSNETKRDVLVDAVDALADAQASGGNIGHQDANLFMAEYAAALPDDLPVIPKAVGEILRSAHGQDNLRGGKITMEFKIGQYVTIPSGEHLQIDEICYCWERLYGVKEKNRIEAVCYLTLNRGCNNKIKIKDYQCTFYSDMDNCAG